MQKKSANCRLIHYGGSEGVTGSCLQLILDENRSLLIDCGLFQGTEAKDAGFNGSKREIDFPIESVFS